MNVELPQDLELELVRLAGLSGRQPGQLAADVLRNYVERGADFRAAVRRGIEQADRGELLEPEEVVERVEQLLK